MHEKDVAEQALKPCGACPKPLTTSRLSPLCAAACASKKPHISRRDSLRGEVQYGRE
jgi:hypothetical protein